jgi:hypothetical protein
MAALRAWDGKGDFVSELGHIERLPLTEWTIQRCGADSIAIGAHENHGYRHYTKIALIDLPNDPVRIEDLEGLGVNHVDGRTVAQG